MEESIINIYDETNSVIKESFNSLRENIKFCSFEKEIKTIAITSSKPREGRTTTSINFAISLAREGYNVLFMDADLRKPIDSKYLAQDNYKGITSYVNIGGYIEDVIYKTSIKNLSYLPCGNDTDNPSEVIGSTRFRQLMLKLRDNFDYVIIDTPALNSVIDGNVIASMTDGTILLVECGSVNKEIAESAKIKLINSNAYILGAILNRINKREYKKYYQYYNYIIKDKKYAKLKIQKHYKNSKSIG